MPDIDCIQFRKDFDAEREKELEEHEKSGAHMLSNRQNNSNGES